MLVLSRKKNERVHLGPDIQVVVVAVEGDKVKLGFEAPKDLRILRAEVLERIAREGGTR